MTALTCKADIITITHINRGKTTEYIYQGSQVGKPSALSLVKGDGYMITYSELFSFVIMICAIIALTKNEK